MSLLKLKASWNGKDRQRLIRGIFILLTAYFEAALAYILVSIVMERDAGLLSSPIRPPSLTIILILVIVSFLTLIPVISIKVYREIILNTSEIPDKRNNLTLREVFQNENRESILIAILQQPGIHYNKLMNKTSLSPGQFQWHIRILLKFNIIKCENMGQYRLFYPMLLSGSKFAEDLQRGSSASLFQQPTTRSIFRYIRENPGTFASKIGRTLDLGRSTVSYHIGKLKDMGLVIAIESNAGRKKHLYPATD